MVASVEATQAIVQDVRRLAEEMESLFGQLQRTGALIAIRRFMELHSEGNSYFDMLDAAKALRSYAGILSYVTGKPPESEIQPVPSNSRPRHTPYLQIPPISKSTKITVSRSEPQRNL